MADVLTKEQRHKNMKNIHGKDTKIEIILRKALWAKLQEVILLSLVLIA